jgi:hypothetical protein
MDASELRACARQEADELAPNRPGSEAEQLARRALGAVVLLAGLADDNVELLREVANGIAAEWSDRQAARPLLDAATLAEIGSVSVLLVVERQSWELVRLCVGERRSRNPFHTLG